MDWIRCLAFFLVSSGKLNGSNIFCTSSALTIFDGLILTVKIFSGFFLATSSISTPPSALEIKAIFELDLSIKHDK